jgi:hypothetical protein
MHPMHPVARWASLPVQVRHNSVAVSTTAQQHGGFKLFVCWHVVRLVSSVSDT